jgi:probable F420-dependent oxidoreductase
MRLGFSLLQFGSFADTAAILRVAKRAEELGYDGVWTGDRLLWPVHPRAPYPGSPNGLLPDNFKWTLDPLELLTFVAAHTSRVTLGTSVINLPFYNPMILARRLTTLDVLSDGRLRAGFGQGWLPDEFEAAGATMEGMGARSNEFLEVLKAIWTADPVEVSGKHFRIPASMIHLKPVQKPHPKIYLAAFTPAAMRRVARYADGWNPAGIPVRVMGAMFGAIRKMAREAGRDPDAMELVIRANVNLSPTSLGDGRPIFAGTIDQIREDIAAVRKMGAHELFFDVQWSPGVDSVGAMIEHMEQFWELARAS